MIQQLRHLAALFPRRDHYKFAFLLFLMIVGAVLEMAGIGIIPAFAGIIVYPDKVLAYPVVGDTLKRLNIDTPQRLLLAGSAAVFVVFLIKNGFMAVNFVLQARFATNRMVQLRTRLFNAYMDASYPFHLQRNSAELMRNAGSEATQIGRSVLPKLLDFLTAVILFISVLLMLFVVQPVAAGIMFAALGSAGGLFVWKTQRVLHRAGHKAQEERKNSVRILKESLMGIKEARVLGCESAFAAAFHKSASISARAVRKVLIFQKMGQPYLETVGIATILLVVLLLVFWLGFTVAETLPILGLFAVALGRLRGAMGKLTQSVGTLRFQMVSIEPVYRDLKLLEAEPGQRKLQDSDSPLPLNKELAVESVTFFYENTDTPALKDISLTIPRGTSVAFVGATGSGKTTLVDVILGLLTPTEGHVRVDGVDVHAHWAAWHKNIGYIPQEIHLLDDTIARNVALGIPDKDIDRNALQAALDAAHLSWFIERLPNGLDTVVGDRGVRISGGQRQRIGIARALYHNPDVLIMDEATASLDNATEKAVVAAVEELKGDRTLITIAHRLSTVQNCDCLYFLNEGCLEDRGTYSELLQRCQQFREMSQARA